MIMMNEKMNTYNTAVRHNQPNNRATTAFYTPTRTTTMLSTSNASTSYSSNAGGVRASTTSSSASSSASAIITGQDEECISCLMTLKHRAITPPAASIATTATKDDVPIPRRIFSTENLDSSGSTTPNVNETCLNSNANSKYSSSSLFTYPGGDAASTSSSSLCIPIGTEEDKHYLDEVQCFIRSNCFEYFISDGRIGMRCSFCKHTTTPSSCSQQSLSHRPYYFPSSISEIFYAADMLQSNHIPLCTMMPMDVKNKIHHLYQVVARRTPGNNSSNNSNNKSNDFQYWINSAKKLGLCDTVDGVHLHPSSTTTNLSSISPTTNASTAQNQQLPTSSHSFHSPQFHHQHHLHDKQLVNRISPSVIHGMNHRYQHSGENEYHNNNNNNNNFFTPNKRNISTTSTCTTPSSYPRMILNNSTPYTTNTGAVNSTFYPLNSMKQGKGNDGDNNNDSQNNISFGYFDSVEEYHRYRCNRGTGSSPLTTMTEMKDRKHTSSFPYDNNQDLKHQPTDATKRNHTTTDKPPLSPAANHVTEAKFNQYINQAQLVNQEDKDLVPDFLFLSMAQMQTCNLTEADRVGCYKEREIGFLGMCCKHCGGQPGFGKYFPATVRSLAQTTTSQTIVKHIALKCRHCPPDIRMAVLALQKEQNEKDRVVKHVNGSAFEARPKYGSRKVFFQRIWERLHGSGSCSWDVHNSNDKRKHDGIPSTTLGPGGSSSSSKSKVHAKSTKGAVVSPHVNEMFLSPPKFRNRCGVHIHNDNNSNGKRSRSVSYAEHEHWNDDYNRSHNKMHRMVSS